jgi:exopolyphosphatase/guanosine-5'-triphosphate,3'-diphosphate pyrophosphatase
MDASSLNISLSRSLSQPLSEVQSLGRDSLSPRILAAIDVGSNSIHMVVVRIDPAIPSFVVIGKAKETVRLGEFCTKTGSLTPEAMKRGYEALERCLQVAWRLQAHSIVAVATSAVREAPNGSDFIAKVQEGLGLTIDLISGQEEARRIYLGALSGLDLNGQPHVFIDIGGGSTELSVGDGEDPTFLRSLKLGAVRLTQQFLVSDPPTPTEMDRLRSHIRDIAEVPSEKIKELLLDQPVRLVGTSGTIETLALWDLRDQEASISPQRIHGYELTLSKIRQFINQIGTLPVNERRKIAGLVERRAEIIIAGAVILEELMTLLGTDRLLYCSRSLREGLIVDWMLAQGLIEDRFRFQSSVRQRHVLRLASKYQVDLDHAEQVAAFAVALFDQTQGILHQWQERERNYLWAASILHNCGHFVSHAAHHKHTYYLIRYGELLGFNEEEVEVIANLARYHRKSPPKKKHENFQKLANDTYRQIVIELSPLLRLATALDRRRVHPIQGIRCHFDSPVSPKTMTLYLQTNKPEDCALELWSLGSKKEVFEDQFQIHLNAYLETRS